MTADRLPDLLAPPRRSWAYRRPVADLWLRPWFDRVSLRFLERSFFPLSSAWAAAEAAAGDPTAFRAALGEALPEDPRLRAALAEVAARAAAWRQAEARWTAALFGDDAGDGARIAAEHARGRTAQRFMAGRRLFLPWRERLPSARWDVDPPEQVRQRHEARLRDLPAAYPAPPPVSPLRSRTLPTNGGGVAWLRFDSSVLGDAVTVRVQEPAVPNARTPSIVLLHGVAMEDEMWPPRADSLAPLTAAGWRVLRPEGPWHGRRRPHGRYGGEPLIARGLGGFLELFQAWLAEIAVLLDWARAQGGPVVLAGISLGALAAQLYASVAAGGRSGPVPDALLLIATSGQVKGAAHDGALARGLGVPRHLAEAGWTDALLDPLLALVEPAGSAVPPERTVLLLGRRDRVTPYGGGRALARRWGVPPENLFQRWQGHFSVTLGLIADPAPLRRLRQIVEPL